MTRALVLGGGGVTGIAWELGVVDAWIAGGIDVRDADLVVGTSAGSTVAAQLTSGASIESLMEQQHDPDTRELLPSMDLDAVIAIFMEAADPSLTAQERCARVGAKALEVETVAEPVRREIIAARLPVHDWPEQALVVTAVDAADGQFMAFDRAGGAGLVDAVAASCAVPGVWPPVTIGAARYIDGGVRSPTNAFLAGGHDRVVVLSPLANNLVPNTEREIDALRAAGATVVLFQADEQAIEEMGANPLDPSKRAVSVATGRRQGAAWLDDLREVWLS